MVKKSHSTELLNNLMHSAYRKRKRDVPKEEEKKEKRYIKRILKYEDACFTLLLSIIIP